MKKLFIVAAMVLSVDCYAEPKLAQCPDYVAYHRDMNTGKLYDIWIETETGECFWYNEDGIKVNASEHVCREIAFHLGINYNK